MSDTAESRDIIKLEAQRQQVAITPMQMLNAAVERGDALEKLEKLMDLNDRWEAAQAKKAYIEAKASFGANAPEIIKDMENKQFSSKYASIGNVVNTVRAELSKHGLVPSWEIDQSGKEIKVTCILTHRQGHSERAWLFGPPDTSGSKNQIQQIKSTLTYLKLATFEAVTGIASKEGNRDDDGNAAGATFISEAKVNELLDLAEKAGADKIKFCDKLGVGSFAEIPGRDFFKAKSWLQTKMLQAKKEQSDGDH